MSDPWNPAPLGDDAHDGVPPKVSRWKGGNVTHEWPVCPGCGGRMQRKRRLCVKCRARQALGAARQRIVVVLLAALLLPALARADVHDALEHSYTAALELRDADHPVEAWFLLNQLVDVVLPRAQQGDRRAADVLARMGRTMGSLLIYFGDRWHTHGLTAAWDDGPDGDCPRLDFGLEHLRAGLYWQARSGRGRLFPYEQLRGLSQVARRKLRQKHCVVQPASVLWPAA